MLGSKKSPSRFTKHNSADPGYPVASKSNPFDSNDESDKKQKVTSSRRRSSETKLTPPVVEGNPFEDYDRQERSSSSYSNSMTSAARSRYRNDFSDSGGLQSQSVEELEGYAAYKAEETTKNVNNCLKIAGEIRGEATQTLIMLHQQGEQITRTHQNAADIDHDLSRGEKLLGSLGGMFSKTWKPHKNRAITGPMITRDEVQRKGNHIEQRERLGLNSAPKGQPKTRAPYPEPTDALQRVEVEKAKQDDALSEISDILGELKDMAIDMGTEIERQNKALEPMHDDVDELNFRVKQANQRGRRLLGK